MVSLINKLKDRNYEIRENFVMSKKNNELISSVIIKLDHLEEKLNRLEEEAGQIRTMKKLPGQRPTIASESKKKKILVGGFFGAFNLGDELMLESFLANVNKGAYEITIMLCDNYTSNIGRYGGYQFVHYPNSILELNDLAYLYDALVFPGGAILDDVDYGLENERLALGTILLTLSKRFIAFNKPCLLYGLSTNENIADPVFIEDLNYVIKKSQHFSLRDSNSLKTLVGAGVDTNNVQIVDDAIFGHPILDDVKPQRRENEIGLIYIFNEENLENLAGFTKKILQTTNKDTVLKVIPFYDYQNNDVVFAKKMIEIVGDDRVKIESSKIENMEDICRALVNKTAVISMRYHGTLLSNILGKSVVCLNYNQHRHYNNKNSYIYDYYGFTKKAINYSDIDSCNADVLKSLLDKKIKRVDVSSYVKKTKKVLGNLI